WAHWNLGHVAPLCAFPHLGLFGLVNQPLLYDQPRPDDERPTREIFPSLAHLPSGPHLLFPHKLVQSDGAVRESTFNRLLLVEGPIRIRAVVPRQGEISEAMEPLAMHVLPVLTEHRLPLGWGPVGRRHDLL